jgi:hypothetical protein
LKSKQTYFSIKPVQEVKMRCSRCTLSDRTPKIAFDQNCVCNYCHSYEKIIYQGEAALLEELESLKKRGRKYDCLLGLSGGRDSTYVLLKLVKDYGMKVLAINYENPFTVPQAKANIENAVKQLGVDVVSFRDDKNHHVKSVAAALRAWLKRPSPALVPVICLGCKPAWLRIYKAALKHDIPAIITGGNPYEIISFKRELVGIAREEEAGRAYLKYTYSLRELIKNPRYLNPHLIKTGLKSFFFGSPYSIGLKMYGHQVKWIQLFDYIEWNEKEILSRLKKELNWSYPAKLRSSWRFDCRIKHLVDFLYSRTLAITDKDEFYAKMVREGQMTRDEALGRLEIENEIHMDEVELVIGKLGMQSSALSEAR